VTSGQKRQLILDGAKKAAFTDATKQPFYFTAGGESARGYHLWKPVQQGQTYVLEDVSNAVYNDAILFFFLFILYKPLFINQLSQKNKIYREACLNLISLGPTMFFGIDRNFGLNRLN
jgi:hypothetical protein